MSRFRNYVTDVAFRLTLGKTHITALQAIKEAEVLRDTVRQSPHLAGWPARAAEMGLWVGALHQLEHRGLVECLPIYDTPNGHFREGAKLIRENLSQPFHRRHKLTPEGQLVWQLLLAAGLVEDVQKPPKRAPAKLKAAA